MWSRFFSSFSPNKAQNELIQARAEKPKPKISLPPRQQSLMSLDLDYGEEELTDYTAFRCIGVTAATIPSINKCSVTFSNVTKGVINKGEWKRFVNASSPNTRASIQNGKCSTSPKPSCVISQRRGSTRDIKSLTFFYRCLNRSKKPNG